MAHWELEDAPPLLIHLRLRPVSSYSYPARRSQRGCLTPESGLTAEIFGILLCARFSKKKIDSVDGVGLAPPHLPQLATVRRAVWRLPPDPPHFNIGQVWLQLPLAAIG